MPEVAIPTGFLLLAEDPGREIVIARHDRDSDRPPLLELAALPEVVIGTLVVAPPLHGRIRTPEEFAALNSPGYAKATLNFVVEEIRAGVSRVRTETRQRTPRTRRRSSSYWRLIYPGRALIRRMWLRAIRLRAERARGQP